LMPLIKSNRSDIHKLLTDKSLLKENIINLKFRVDSHELKIQEIDQALIFDRAARRKRIR